ncbi:MAG: glycosyltransferase family 1 protein [Lachnospiraceae bacterium]|nr:glycosyltransferase family 1 protein [Lachnospiraceae bacterium]
MHITRIILIKGAVETLEFFSMQLAETFKQQGLDVWFWDMKSPLDSRETFESFHNYEHTAFLTFNFIGLSGESQFQSAEHISLWEYYHINIFCIMVDHPMYYYRPLHSGIKKLTLFCIDRDHQRFTQHYYPEYGKVHFLPLAGTLLPGTLPSFSERKTDVIFTGNYIVPENLTPHIQHMDAESKDFYFDIIKELIQHPDISMERMLIQRLTREFPQITKEETLSCMYHMIFIDLYVRSWFRREIICSLAEQEIPVAVIGKDWEKAPCRRPENIMIMGQQDSLSCLTAMQTAKISINIMPWFKDGAHDRIFNAMLQGCAVVTDTSHYLKEFLREDRDYVTFSLEQRDIIAEKIQYLLSHPAQAENIAVQGRKTAIQSHTWGNRACRLLDIFVQTD